MIAWLRGWPPRRLYRAAAWCLPMVAVWLAAIGAVAPGLAAVPPARRTAPGWTCGRLAAAGHLTAAAVVIAPAAVPLGLLAGGLAWSLRIWPMAARRGRPVPGSAIAFDRRQWRHQARSARRGSPRPERCRC